VNISVIIPALNEAASIELAARSAWEAGADEVIVVDGGSRDETADIAKGAKCRILPCAAGRAVQQNAGAAVANGEVLLFLHADNWLDSTAIEQVRQVMQDTNVRVGAMKQQIAANGIAYRWLERGNAWRARRRGLPYGDQAIFIRRELFDRLDGFPNVKLMEDLLLMKKARQISRPRLIDGPVHVDARRWKRHGVVRQTLRNWSLVTAHRFGCSPDRLATYYRSHDVA
jgi:rSAM/selenodomain-associated transferase 2